MMEDETDITFSFSEKKAALEKWSKDSSKVALVKTLLLSFFTPYLEIL